MLLRTLTLNALPYVVGVAAAMAAGQYVLPSAGQASGPRAVPAAYSAPASRAIVNRLHKSDRLPLRRAAPRSGDKAPVTAPPALAPRPTTNDCKPFAVGGRCFAGGRQSTST